jgi:hypothetical protein
LIGKQFKGDDPNRKLIGEFSDITDFFLQPSVNDALQMFPFLRHLPGSYGKQFKRATKAIETIIDVYFKQQKVRGIFDVASLVADLYHVTQYKLPVDMCSENISRFFNIVD